MENLQAFAEAVGRDIKDLQARAADGSGDATTGDWVTFSDFAKIKRSGDVVTLDVRVPTGSSSDLVNTGWVTLSEYAKIKRFGDVVTLDLNLPTTVGTVLGTIPAEMFSVGETALTIPVSISARSTRTLRIEPTGEMKISGQGASIRTQVTLMA